jgi:hypothetical protein
MTTDFIACGAESAVLRLFSLPKVYENSAWSQSTAPSTAFA